MGVRGLRRLLKCSLPLRLGASGEEIGLYASDGTTPIDTLSFGEQSTDICYGRFPDGSNTWKFLDTPTPGASNN